MEENKPAEIIAEKNQVSISMTQAVILNACIIAASIIIGALIIHGSFDGGAKSGSANDSATQPTLAVDIKNVNMQGEPFIGNPNAKVTIAYWSDYQCPFCKKFETTTFQDILKKYVASGDVKIVFKDYAFLGSDSDAAALYEHAVWKLYPNEYFAWRTAMYNAQDDENAGFGDEASIVKLTGTISGIDAAKVQADAKKNKNAYMQLIDADKAEGTALGIQGTPSFVTGTQLIQGYVQISAFTKVLGDQLK